MGARRQRTYAGKEESWSIFRDGVGMPNYGETRTSGHVKGDKTRLPLHKKVSLRKKSAQVELWPQKTWGGMLKHQTKEGAERTGGLQYIRCGFAPPKIVGEHAFLHALR